MSPSIRRRRLGHRLSKNIHKCNKKDNNENKKKTYYRCLEPPAAAVVAAIAVSTCRGAGFGGGDGVWWPSW
jgi:hypothetical protein